MLALPVVSPRRRTSDRFAALTVGVAAMALLAGAAHAADPLQKRIDELGGSLVRDPAGKVVEINLENCSVKPDDVKLIAAQSDLKKLRLWGRTVTDEVVDLLLGMPKLVDLSLINTQVTDKSVTKLAVIRPAALPQLRALSFQGSGGVTNAAIDDLLRMKDLTHLTVCYTSVDSQGIVKLGALKKLKLLDLRGCRVSNDALAVAEQLPALVALKFRSPALADEGMVHLQNAKTLRGLHLEDARVGDAGMKLLAGLTAMDDLNLMRVPITSEGLAAVAGMTKMRTLNLRGTYIDDDGLKHLAGMKDLVKLDLSETGIEGPGIAHLSGLTKLEWLNLWNSFIDDGAMEHLARLSGLKDLNLDATIITDEGLAQLAPLKNLRKLSVSQTTLSPEAIAKLEAAIPGLKVTR